MTDLNKEKPSALPVLYSFRRCPYAMRARMALKYSGLHCEVREILLRDKPDQMLNISPKATVPVLLLPDGRVIEESFDIMLWALRQNDPDNWMAGSPQAASLIERNDGAFKNALDKYKYASRHPEHPQGKYRTEGETFLQLLNNLLEKNTFLLNDRPTLGDMALFPFIRQFAGVDRLWFDKTPYTPLKKWLQGHLESDLFNKVMNKRTPWKSGDPVCTL